MELYKVVTDQYVTNPEIQGFGIAYTDNAAPDR